MFTYKIIRGLLDKDLCKDMTDFMWKQHTQGGFYYDAQCKTSPAFLNLFSSVNVNLAEKLSKELNFEVFPTYNHCRLYFPGEILEPHKDKLQCEIGTSITLGYEGEKPWPIYIYQDNEIVEANLEIGDALVYKGFDTLHWRNKYVEGNWQTQAFLFYNTTPRFDDPIIGDLRNVKLVTEFDTWRESRQNTQTTKT